ncbi:Uncharacterised protein [Halioglobus japonicus]|nr:Uncharacterised protein [Halioglobus japonicus]
MQWRTQRNTIPHSNFTPKQQVAGSALAYFEVLSLAVCCATAITGFAGKSKYWPVLTNTFQISILPKATCF